MSYRLKESENGVILVNKPVGITSFRVVAGVRRYLLRHGSGTHESLGVQGLKGLDGTVRRLKVGHTGTLDSMASGLLILLVGEATKRQADFTRLPKEYVGEFILGVESDTYSADGRLKFFAGQGAEHAVPLLLERLATIKRTQIEEVFNKFQGEQEQTVPPFSAVQVGGERLHKLARKGRPLPKLPRRKIKIESLELLDFQSVGKLAGQARPLHGTTQLKNPDLKDLLDIAPRIRFRTCVSSGTYVRSLVVDIGRELGTGAVLTQLTRTEIGPYRLSDAIDLPDLK
jgi:tRNA pseudouridine55 synthase